MSNRKSMYYYSPSTEMKVDAVIELCFWYLMLRSGSLVKILGLICPLGKKSCSFQVNWLGHSLLRGFFLKATTLIVILLKFSKSLSWSSLAFILTTIRFFYYIYYLFDLLDLLCNWNRNLISWHSNQPSKFDTQGANQHFQLVKMLRKVLGRESLFSEIFSSRKVIMKMWIIFPTDENALRFWFCQKSWWKLCAFFLPLRMSKENVCNCQQVLRTTQKSMR